MDVEKYINDKGTFQINNEYFVDGRDLKVNPPLTASKIFLWDHFIRKIIIENIPHGEKVKLVCVTYNEKDDTHYFLIESSGGKIGWISEYFLSPEKHEAIGNII